MHTDYKKLVQSQENLASLATAGLSSEISEMLCVARQFTLLLYGPRAKSHSLFPSTDDAFKQHFLCVKYQGDVWVHSYLENPLLWELADNGWRFSNEGILELVFFQKSLFQWNWEISPTYTTQTTVYCHCYHQACHVHSSALIVWLMTVLESCIRHVWWRQWWWWLLRCLC